MEAIFLYELHIKYCILKSRVPPDAIKYPIIVPMSQVKKLRLGELEELAQGHIASRWQSTNVIPVFSGAKFHTLVTILPPPHGNTVFKKTSIPSALSTYYELPPSEECWVGLQR